MNKDACIFAADCHLRRSAWIHSGIDGDSYHSFAQVVDLATSHDVPLLLGGDIFDTTRPDAEDVAFVRGQMDRMEAHGLPVYYWRGNHDSGGEQAWLSAMHSWPTHVHEKVFSPCGGLRFLGLDWLPGGAVNARLGDVDDDIDALCYHGACKELMRDRSGSRSEFSLASVPCRYALLGDCHKTEVLAYSPAGMATVCGRAYSPGSLHMTEIKEPEDKYVFLLQREGDGLKHSQLGLQTRPVFRFQLADEAAMQDFLTHRLAFVDARLAEQAKLLPEGLRRPLLRVVYSESIPDAYARLEEACRGKYHLFPKGQAAEAREQEVLATAEKLASGGLAAAIEGYDASDEVKADIASLLESDDPSSAIDAICSNFIERRTRGAAKTA